LFWIKKDSNYYSEKYVNQSIDKAATRPDGPNENECVKVITDPTGVAKNHPLILEIDILEKSRESYTPRLSPAIAKITMVAVVVEACEELVGFGNYGFQKQIQGHR